jgi:hypothetical protein
MQLNGDPEGIQALRTLHDKDKAYLKFLVGEALTNVDLTARFKTEDGRHYQVKFDPKTGNLVVVSAA